MFLVKAPYVMLKLIDGATGVATMRGLYAGQPVPPNVEAESLKRHLDEDLVEVVADAVAAEPGDEEKAEPPKKAAPAKVQPDSKSGS